MNSKFLSLGIVPVWIFDGKASSLKHNESQRRRNLKEENLKKKELSLQEKDLQNALKFAKRAIFLNESEIENAKTMLKLSGIPLYESPIEADPLLCFLERSKQVDFVISSDSDLLAYGIGGILRREAIASKDAKSDTFEFSSLAKVLENLEFDLDQFTDFCILLGTDFNLAAWRLGPVTAFKMMKEFGNLEDLFASRHKDKFDFSAYKDFEIIRNTFQSVRGEHFGFTETDGQTKEIEDYFTRKEIQPDLLSDFYESKDFSYAKIEKLMAVLLENQNILR